MAVVLTEMGRQQHPCSPRASLPQQDDALTEAAAGKPARVVTSHADVHLIKFISFLNPKPNYSNGQLSEWFNKQKRRLSTHLTTTPEDA